MKIIGASVVFVCDRDFSIIRDGGVAYEGERIVEVGVYDELVAKYTKSPTAKRSFFRKQGIPLGDSRCFFRKQATAVQGAAAAGFLENKRSGASEAKQISLELLESLKKKKRLSVETPAASKSS